MNLPEGIINLINQFRKDGVNDQTIIDMIADMSQNHPNDRVKSLANVASIIIKYKGLPQMEDTEEIHVNVGGIPYPVKVKKSTKIEPVFFDNQEIHWRFNEDMICGSTKDGVILRIIYHENGWTVPHAIKPNMTTGQTETCSWPSDVVGDPDAGCCIFSSG